MTASSPTSSSTTASAAGTQYVLRTVAVAITLYVSFSIWAVYHERVSKASYYTNPEDYAAQNDSKIPWRHFQVTNFLVTLCWTSVAVTAIIVRWFLGNPVKFERCNPIPWIGVNILHGIGVTLSYSNAAALPYALYLTLKMGKMIPTAIIGTFLEGKRYSLAKYVSAMMVTFGAIWFKYSERVGPEKAAEMSAAKSVMPPERHDALFFKTILLVLFNMMIEGAISPLQEKLQKATPSGKMDAVQATLMTNLPSYLFVFGMWSVQEHHALLAQYVGVSSEVLSSFGFAPEWSEGWQIVMTDPNCLINHAGMGISNAIGGIAIMFGVAHLGSLSLTAIMTFRKISSVLVSVLLVNSGNPILARQWAAIAVAALGVILDTADGVRSKIMSRKKSSNNNQGQKEKKKSEGKNTSSAVASKNQKKPAAAAKQTGKKPEADQKKNADRKAGRGEVLVDLTGGSK